MSDLFIASRSIPHPDDGSRKVVAAGKVERAEAAPEVSPCGTYGAAQRHRKRNEPLDQACKDAERAYMRGYRSRKGPGNDRWWNRTRHAALERLAAEYPERFAELLAEVRESEQTPWDPGDPP